MNEEQIFAEAIQLAINNREVFLKKVCGTNEVLRRRVEQLLEAHESQDSFLKEAESMKSTADVVASGRHPVIGNYKLLHKLGEGGFGVVYMAEQMRPVRRKVALKIVKAERMSDATATVARFEAERQALAMMDHPNIATVFDGGSIPAGSSLLDEVLGAVERPFFVMELVNGVPITEYCNKNKLTTRERLKLFVSVCLAVQHAHQKGVIHRDLKPSNILVTLHDGVPVVKIIDFGVAKAINQQLTDKTLYTVLGAMIGTPQYMSPEQAERSGLDIDTRSDIYSLGVLLYELLTGTTPLSAQDLKEAGILQVQRCIVESEPPKPSTRLSNSGEELTVIAKHRSVSADRLRKDLQGDLDWIVMKALEKDRQRRYDTAKGFAVDVERFLNDEAISARPPSKIYLLNKFARKNRGPVVVGIAVLASLIVGLAGVAYSYVKTRDALIREQVARTDEKAATEKAKQFGRELSEKVKLVSDLNRTNQAQLESQALILAFEAFNSGNVVQASDYLSKLNPEPGTAASIPWRFLRKRIEELAPEEIEFGETIQCWDLAADGSHVVVCLADGTIVYKEMNGPKDFRLSVRKVFPDHEHDEFEAVALSSNNKSILVACRTKENGTNVRVLRVAPDGGLEVPEPNIEMHHSASVRQVGFLAGGNVAASLDWEDGLKLWDAASVELLNTLPRPRNSGFGSSPDGELLVTFGFDGMVNFLSPNGTPLPGKPHKTGHRIKDVDIIRHGAGYLFAVAGYDGANLWSAVGGEYMLVRRFNWQRALRIQFSIDGRTLAVFSQDAATVSVFDVSSGRRLSLVPESRFRAGGMGVQLGHKSTIRAFESRLHLSPIPKEGKQFSESDAGWYSDFAASSSSSILAFRRSKYELGIWDASTHSLSTIDTAPAEVNETGFAVSATGNRVAAVLSDGPEQQRVQVWDRETKRELYRVRQTRSNEDGWHAIQFHPRQEDLLVSTLADEIEMSNLASGTRTTVGRSSTTGARLSCEFSPSGKKLVVGGSIWNEGHRTTNTLLYSIAENGAEAEIAEIDVSKVYRAVINHDESMLAIICIDSTEILLWDMAKRQFVDVVPVGATRLLSIAFSPGGECLIATNPAGELRFLDYRNHRELGRFKIDHPVRHVRFFDDNRRIAVSSIDGYLMQWEY